MCIAVATYQHRLSKKLILDHGLSDRMVNHALDVREDEAQFHYRHRNPVLPVLRQGRLDIIEWGNRDRTDIRIPKTGWCRHESLFKGKWDEFAPEPVVIPAIYALDDGGWFKIMQGIEAVLVHDELGSPHVYMVTEPASNWYRAIMLNERMPRLIGQML